MSSFKDKVLLITGGTGSFGNAIIVQHSTSLAFAFYGAIFMYSGMLSTIANGLAMMKVQTISYLVAVFLKIAILLTLFSSTNWDFVVWVNIIILVPYVISQQVILNKYLI